jgi:hypothetical protein
MDCCNVCCIEAISDYGKRILLGFIDEEATKVSNVSLDYTGTEEAISKFSIDYLEKIMDILSYGESVKLSVKKDYPLTIQNEDFKIILAPRIDGQD